MSHIHSTKTKATNDRRNIAMPVFKKKKYE